METTFKHGNPLMVDHIPGSAVSAGQVVVVGEIPFVAHVDIAASRIGSLAMGGGVYECKADADLGPGVKVYWDDTANKITVTASSGARKHFGYILPDSDPAADGDPVLVRHSPDASSV